MQRHDLRHVTIEMLTWYDLTHDTFLLEQLASIQEKSEQGSEPFF